MVYRRAYRKWTEEELNFLRENYKSMTHRKIAEGLGRTKKTVECKCIRLKLYKPKKWNKEKVLVKLKQTYDKLGKSPTGKYLIQNHPALYGVINRYHGNLNKALKQAGLPINQVYEYKLQNKNMTPELAYILGTLYGDGYMANGVVGLQVNDYDFALEFCNCIEKWSGIKPRVYYRQNRNAWQVCLNSIRILEFLKKIDMEDIKNFNDEIKGLFLRGLFDSEGCVYLRINPRKVRRLSFSNTNHQIIKIVSELLNFFNIKHNIRKNVFKPSFNRKDVYVITTSGRQSYIKFKEHIDFTILRKKEKLEKVINSYEVLK